MKSKLLHLLIPALKGRQRWWHRLFDILIYASTLIILLGSLLAFLLDDSWKIFTYTAYSFEENYSAAEGKEVDCSFSYSFSSIRCGDIKNSTEFMETYTKARGTYDILVGTRNDGYTDDDAIRFVKNIEDVKVKKVTSLVYPRLLMLLAIIIGATLGWFIFWKTIIYRIVLYIVYGKNIKEVS